MSEKLISTNPATGEVLWEGIPANSDEVIVAVRLAKEAQRDWGNTSLKEREAVLHEFQKIVESEKETFAETISKETGKPLWESRSEVAALANKVEISIEAQKRRCPSLDRDLKNAFLHTRHKPLGICAVFGPFNFPAHLPNGHIVPALLAGNTVVFKPSELTPLVGIEMVRLWKKAGIPEGVITLVLGGAETGQAMAENPDLNGLFFTGSWRTGKILAEKMGKRPDVLIALEMGGNNPLVIGQVTDHEAAAYLTVQSAYLTSGQRCTCARRAIIPQGGTGERFIEELITWISKIKVGAYTENPEPFMGPVISEPAADGLLRAQKRLIDLGGKPLKLMERIEKGKPFLSPGIIDMSEVEERPDEEFFGPLLQVIRVKNFEDALREADNTRYGLVASLLSDSEAEYQQFYRVVNAGVINWNTQTTGASSTAPFGGVKQSGNFRPSAFYAADYCNYPVASLESSRLKFPETLCPGIRYKT